MLLKTATDASNFRQFFSVSGWDHIQFDAATDGLQFHSSKLQHHQGFLTSIRSVITSNQLERLMDRTFTAPGYNPTRSWTVQYHSSMGSLAAIGLPRSHWRTNAPIEKGNQPWLFSFWLSMAPITLAVIGKNALSLITFLSMGKYMRSRNI